MIIFWFYLTICSVVLYSIRRFCHTCAYTIITIIIFSDADLAFYLSSRLDCLLGQFLFVVVLQCISPHMTSLKNTVVVHQIFARLAGGGTSVLHDGVVLVGQAIGTQCKSCTIRMRHLTDLPDFFVFDRFDVRTGFRYLSLDQIEYFLVVFHTGETLWKTNAKVDISVVQMNVANLAGGWAKLDDVRTGDHVAILYRIPVSVAVILEFGCVEIDKDTDTDTNTDTNQIRTQSRILTEK